jgi:Flp pilus assembly pilin Flp
LEGGTRDLRRRQGGQQLFLKGQFHERRDEKGQALVEYALILALTTVFALGALQLMSGTIVMFLNSVASALGAAL